MSAATALPAFASSPNTDLDQQPRRLRCGPGACCPMDGGADADRAGGGGVASGACDPRASAAVDRQPADHEDRGADAGASEMAAKRDSAARPNGEDRPSTALSPSEVVNPPPASRCSTPAAVTVVTVVVHHDPPWSCPPLRPDAGHPHPVADDHARDARRGRLHAGLHRPDRRHHSVGGGGSDGWVWGGSGVLVWAGEGVRISSGAKMPFATATAAACVMLTAFSL